MSRGIMFHISTDPNDMGTFSFEDLTDKLDILGVDRIEDRFACDSVNDTSVLKFMLRGAGFKIADMADCKTCAAMLLPMPEQKLNDAKSKFFKNNLDNLKVLIANMTEQDFATKDAVYEIKRLVDDTHGDAVWLDTGTGPAPCSLMSFVRGILPDRTYYLSATTVYMH